MKHAREKATERYWRASKRVLTEDPTEPVALSVLNTVATFDSDDVALLSTAAANSLLALQSRRNGTVLAEFVADVVTILDGDGPCAA